MATEHADDLAREVLLVNGLTYELPADATGLRLYGGYEPMFRGEVTRDDLERARTKLKADRARILLAESDAIRAKALALLA